MELGPTGNGGAEFANGPGQEFLRRAQHDRGPARERSIVRGAWVGSTASRSQVQGDRAATWRVGTAEALQVRLLQLGLAFVFLYASLTTLVDPLQFATYVPSWLSMPGMGPMLRCFACFELALAMALLTRRFARHAALVAVMTLVGITATNPDEFEVLFRNVAIICAALALAVSTPALPRLNHRHHKHLRRRRAG